MAADMAAKAARLRYEQRHGLSTGREFSATLLQQHFQLLYDLHCARDKWLALNEQKLHLNSGHRNSSLMLRDLQGWTVETAVENPICNNLTNTLDACLWGTEYSAQVYQLLRLLQFPDSPSDDDPGISWYELAASFMLTSQSGIIIKGAGPGEPFRPRRLDKNDTDISFGVQVYSFERCLTQVVRTLGLPSLPKRRKFCTSVKMLGLRNAKPGSPSENGNGT